MAEVFGRELAETGGRCECVMFACRGLSLKLCELIHRVMTAGGMAAIPAMEDAATLVPTDALAGFSLDEDAPPTVVVRTAGELLTFLDGGFGAWQQYLGRVLDR